MDIRARITADKDSDHFGLAEIEEPDPDVTPEPTEEPDGGSEETPPADQ